MSSGGRSKRKGKTGERNFRNFAKRHHCHIAMTEISGLAGDDSFIKDKNGKWWSIEVKNTASAKPAFINQAMRQADERFRAIQEELTGPNADMFYAMGLDRFRKQDWVLVWHPSGYGVSTDSFVAFYNKGRRRVMKVLNDETGWDL